MKDKTKEIGDLTSLRLQIGELIEEAYNAGLHGKPYQTYDQSQTRLRGSIIQQFGVIEDKLVSSLRWQERAYSFFNNILIKFTKDNSSITEKDIGELILNTDKELLNKDIPFSDKINQAIQMLSEKVAYTRKTLLDIYYIHRTVELEGYRIGWFIPESTCRIIIEIIDNYFNINNSYATTAEYYLLKQISDAKNFDDAYYLYYDNLDLLLDVTFIKVNNGDEGTFIPVDLYKPFESIENISENLYSPFYGGKVNFVSGMSTQRIHNITMSQRNVSLDVNTVSYIRTMADGRIDKLPSKHIKDLIRNILIIKNASSFDYLPYILENYVFSPSNEERIMQTVKSVERYFYPDDEWYNLQCAENIKLVLKEDKAIEQVKKDYSIGYALLLLICYINFKFYKMKILQKLENFCLYMDKMFFIFRDPFVEIAFNFFERGNQYRFFKKIQRNSKTIDKDLKNMAWDVFHLWSLEAACSTEDMGADLLIPYFYCFDKGLLELKECFDLETLFVNQRTGERICFYHKHSYPIKIINQYKTIEKEKRRRANFSYDNITAQIEFLENEINSLW